MLVESVFGFGRAPVSRVLLILVAGMSLILPLTLRARASVLAQLWTLRLSPWIWPKLQFWRFLTCHLIFSSPQEVIFGSLFLYSFREFERRLGTRKFSVRVDCRKS